MTFANTRNGDAIDILESRFQDVKFEFHHCSVKWKELFVLVDCGVHEPFVTKWRNIKFEDVHPCRSCKIEILNFEKCKNKFKKPLTLLTRGLGQENKVKVLCDKHGESVVNMRRLMKYESSPCKTCEKSLNSDVVLFSSRFKFPFMDFSGFVYKGYFHKSFAVCRIHGNKVNVSFNDIARSSFLCGDCLKEHRQQSVWGFGFRAVEKLCKLKRQDFARFYILNCFGEGEVFYKVGITTCSIRSRYPNKNTMPYDFKVLLDIQLAPKVLCDLENHLKFNSPIERYEPKLYFGGCKTESFICDEENIFNIVGDFLNERF